ncbi:hypothetical protein LG649_03865, partial [Tamlana sp. PT2-4]|nr:hypothetical protein [Tamlana laminarinivorans]
RLAQERAEAEAAAAKAEQERLAAEAKSKAEAEAEAKRLAQERTEAEAAATKAEQERLAAEAKTESVIPLEGVVIPTAKDKESIEMKRLAELSVDQSINQSDLLNRLKDLVGSKQKDLDDLKEENDLSDQGIFRQPKPFKSVSAENARLEAVKRDLDKAIVNQSNSIKELEEVYKDRLKSTKNAKDEVNEFYNKEIDKLKSYQTQLLATKQNLLTKLDEIKVATDYENKRRIKRAAFDNEQARYNKDRAALQVIKQNTQVSTTSPTIDSFDFGEVVPNNISILNNIPNVDSGFYLVLAVHSDVEKRDDFVRKVIQSGERAVDFFYDVNTSKYYIYSKVFSNLNQAQMQMQKSNTEPYTSKASVVNVK